MMKYHLLSKVQLIWIKQTYLRLGAGDVCGVLEGVTEGVTEGVPVGVDCADVVSLSSVKSPLGIFNFCKSKVQGVTLI